MILDLNHSGPDGYEALDVIWTTRLTRNGSQNIRDEDLHEGLIHQVITGVHPLQHILIPAEQNQSGPWQAALDLAHTAASTTITFQIMCV